MIRTALKLIVIPFLFGAVLLRFIMIALALPRGVEIAATATWGTQAGQAMGCIAVPLAGLFLLAVLWGFARLVRGRK